MSNLLLFDWDRTISYVEGPTNDLLKQVFYSYGDDSYLDFIAIFRKPENQGRKVVDRLNDILGKEVGERYYERFVELKKQNTIKTSLFAGILEEIIKVKSINDSLLGLVTNKTLIDVREERLVDIDSTFDMVIGGDNIGGDLLKPSGYMIDELISDICISVDRVIIIGDTSNDLNSLGNSRFDGEKIGCLATWSIQDKEKELQLARVEKNNLDRVVEVNDVAELFKKVNRI